MKKIVIISLTLAFILSLTLSSGAEWTVEDKRASASDTVNDFYGFMSTGRLTWITNMLLPELKDKLGTGDEKVQRLEELLDLTDDVKNGKKKILVRSLGMNSSSIDGSRIAAKVKYTFRIENVKEGKKEDVKGRDRIVLKRIRGHYFIESIEKLESK